VKNLKLDQYVKAIVALLAAVAAAIATGVGNGALDQLDFGQWVGVALTILTGTAATWFAENVEGVAGGIIKAILGAATSLLTAVQVGWQNDGMISQGEWFAAAAAALLALTAVYQLRNTPPSNA
jgi:hypothetical protein